jgi:hypothetical protein
MSDAPDPTAPLDLRTTHIHLSTDARAHLLPDFQWNQQHLEAYMARFADTDGANGRLVSMFDQPASWDSWERHPAGDEIVLLVSGRVDLIQDIDGELRTIPLGPGQAAVNPPNVWHTADVHEPGLGFFITPGNGTEHKPR